MTAAVAEAAGINGDIVIDVAGLTKSFGGHVVVRDLTMQVRRGLIYGFLGPNGSGKTTTIRMLCGLLRPDSGRGTCLGHDITSDAEAIRRQVGYMTQRFSLYADLSIRENLEFIARVYGLDRPREKAREAIRRLGLTSRADQLAETLSGGWKQRLALGACIMPQPKLLLLDEPTAGVDPKARRDFWDEIHQLADEGMTILVSTHYMDEAERCHELAYIAYGDLLAQGTAEQMVAASGLATWSVSGTGLGDLSARLREADGVDMVAPFGTALHVSGHDRARLAAAIGAFRRPGLTWVQDKPTLEDVFIHLIGQARDNFN